MDYKIRKLRQEEVKVLDTFLYEAIFVPEGVPKPKFEIIESKELQVYVADFGKREGDLCFVSEAEGKIIGAVWCRIMNDYGHIDDNTPSLAISLLKDYRSRGIGTALMKRILEELKNSRYDKVSLSVQKQNHAAKMYRDLGFTVESETNQEYIMVYKLKDN